MTRQVLKPLLGGLLGVVVAAVCLHFLLTPGVLAEVSTAVADAAWAPLGLAVALVFPIQYLRAWRFGLFLVGTARPPDRRLFRIASYLVLFNYLLPMRLGEATFPVLVRRAYGTGYVAGFGFLALTRVMDLVAVLAIGGLVGSAALGDPRLQRLALVGGCIAALLLVALPYIAALSSRWLPRVEARLPRLGRMTGKLAQGFHQLGSRPHYLGFLALTLAVWVLQYGVAWLVLTGMTDVATLGRAVVGNSAAILSFALPINGVAGLGPLQAAWAWALGQTGVDWSVGVASGLVLNAVMVVGAVLVAGVAWVFCGGHQEARGSPDEGPPW